MGKVQARFGNGFAGAVSRSIDDIIISVKNAGAADIPFGAPVFLSDNGAVLFDISDPQEFDKFLGFAVRVADKTPDVYPADQTGTPTAGVWHPGDVMEVLVRGNIAIELATSGVFGGKVYIRKSDGKLTTTAGSSGSTIQLENVRVHRPRDINGTIAEVTVNKRNTI